MNRDEICARFLDALRFDPYPFQEEALLAWFEDTDGVLVSAPTGMGKTVIAEAAVFEALSARRRLYYTTPLIALTDQKFREFQDRAEAWGFSRDDVGLITGNRRENPEAPVRVVVAEILLNHLIAGEESFDDVAGVVMDEFHNFNDFERGIVWELSLVLLPKTVRLLLLSATVGNTAEFIRWLKDQHGRSVRLVATSERKVPLEYVWVGDKLMTEHLPEMVSSDDAANRTPALVFCFNRDECWEVAEKLKGLKLIEPETRTRIEELLDAADFAEGIGPKLRQMLIRGVGVHHAGILPKHKEVVERLFLEKLIPFVICTETLAAGINLPARSVVLSTLMKGPFGDKKLVPSASAHQMFGRAGRPQFDKRGYVYALAHEDDVKIHKWKVKYDAIDSKSKDPGVMRIRKQLEKKRPTRRKTEQYWTEGQFQMLIKAGPAKLASRAMIPYQVLIYLLTKQKSLDGVRAFIEKRFNRPERIKKFQDQLDHMIANLQAFGYLTASPDGHAVTLDESIRKLTHFRSVDPVYAAFLADELNHADFTEKLQVLESVLPLPGAIEKRIRLPELEPGPLERERLQPLLISMGIVIINRKEEDDDRRGDDRFTRDEHPYDPWATGEEDDRPPTFPEMLKLVFDAKLTTPEEILVQPKWVAGGVFEAGDFYKFGKDRNLEKNEGLVLRHLLRLVILAGEFHALTEDPAYQELAAKCTEASRQVDPRYTDRFLAKEEEAKQLTPTPSG